MGRNSTYSRSVLFNTGNGQAYLSNLTNISNMGYKKDREKLIGKLMKIRKEENSAFIKILNAIEGKETETGEESPELIKPKSKKK